MNLIKAEENVQLNKLNEAKEALLVVAKRNLDIKSTNDLPSEKENLMSFIKAERARELFQVCVYMICVAGMKESVYMPTVLQPSNLLILITKYQI